MIIFDDKECVDTTDCVLETPSFVQVTFHLTGVNLFSH